MDINARRSAGIACEVAHCLGKWNNCIGLAQHDGRRRVPQVLGEKSVVRPREVPRKRVRDVKLARDKEIDQQLHRCRGRAVDEIEAAHACF